MLLVQQMQCRPDDDDEEWAFGTAGMDRLRGGDELEDPFDADDAAGGPAGAQEYFDHFNLPGHMGPDEMMAHVAGMQKDGQAAEGWSKDRLKQPLYPGCPYSVEHFSYALFKIKTGSIHDDRADLLCKLFAKVMPPGYNGPGYVLY